MSNYKYLFFLNETFWLKRVGFFSEDIEWLTEKAYFEISSREKKVYIELTTE